MARKLMGLAGVLIALLVVAAAHYPALADGPLARIVDPPLPSSETPAPMLPANKSRPISELLSRSAVEETIKLPAGVKRLEMRMITWGEHLQAAYAGKVRDYSVDRDRMVWVMKDAYPDTFTYRGKTWRQAVVTTTFDAETGHMISLEVEGTRQ